MEHQKDRKKNLIIADDDKDLISILGIILGSEYDLELFTSSKAVEDRISQKENARSIDGLILDNDMGEGLHGKAIALIARKMYPDLYIMLQTGSLNEDYSQQRASGIDIIYKPFDPIELKKSLREKLEIKK